MISPPPPPGSADQWYLRKSDGQSLGPITKAQLDAWVADGLVEPDNFVLCQGWTSWKTAGDVFVELISVPELPLPPSPKYAPATSWLATNRQSATRPSFLLPIITTILGIAAGCVIGFFAAHHFAFFGGVLLFGKPYSPARYTLVPGHMLLCGTILGAVGLGIGVFARKSNT